MKHSVRRGIQITGWLFKNATGDAARLAEAIKKQSVRYINAQPRPRMKIKYTIPIVFFMALVIIEKENNIISR